jgi:hypothetical protein
MFMLAPFSPHNFFLPIESCFPPLSSNLEGKQRPESAGLVTNVTQGSREIADVEAKLEEKFAG